MRASAQTLAVAVALVGVPIGALIVARTGPPTPLPGTAAMRRSYFLAGERQCEKAIQKIEAQQGDGQLLGFAVLADVGKYPKEFRQAVEAGCQAATG